MMWRILVTGSPKTGKPSSKLPSNCFLPTISLWNIEYSAANAKSSEQFHRRVCPFSMQISLSQADQLF